MYEKRIYSANYLIENIADPDNFARLMELYEESFYSIKFTEWLISKINEKNLIFCYFVENPNYFSITSKLIDEGANIGAIFRIGKVHNNNLLHLAVRRNNKKIIYKIIEKNKNQLYHRNEKGDRPIDLTNDIKLLKKINSKISILENNKIETPISPTPKWKSTSCEEESKWLSDATYQLQWKNLDDIKTIEQNVSNQRWGSGFMIADTLGMTAGHCFDKQMEKNGWYILDKEEQKPLKPYEFLPLIKVNFNYEYDRCDSTLESSSNSSKEITMPDLKPVQEFNVVRLAEYRINKLDYAIIELNKPVSKTQKVALCADLPSSEDEVVVTQHPKGLDKKVDQGNICKVENGKLFYQLDTDHGSSGSPVGLKTLQSVVAVHTTGFKPDDETKCNSGVSINEIKKVSKILSSTNYGFIFKKIEVKNKEKEVSVSPENTLQNYDGQTQRISRYYI